MSQLIPHPNTQFTIHSPMSFFMKGIGDFDYAVIAYVLEDICYKVAYVLERRFTSHLILHDNCQVISCTCPLNLAKSQYFVILFG